LIILILVEHNPVATCSLNEQNFSRPVLNRPAKRSIAYCQEPSKRHAGSKFQLIKVFASSKPSAVKLSIFSYGSKIFIARADLLRVLECPVWSKFALSKADIPINFFKIWAKDNNILLGNRSEIFYIADRNLIELFIRVPHTVQIGNDLSTFLGI